MSLKCTMLLLALACGIGWCAYLEDPGTPPDKREPPLGRCYDKKIDCSRWAYRGLCNQYSVVQDCPQSCRIDCVPCRDLRPDCHEHLCHSHPGEEFRYCPKTCGACTL